MKTEAILQFKAKLLKKYFVGQKQYESIKEAKIYGNSVEEICNMLWEKTSPYMIRKAVFEDGTAKWHEKESPTREDLDSFVVVVDKVGKKNFVPSHLKEKTIEMFRDRKIIIYVYVYSNDVDTKSKFKMMEAQLLGDYSNIPVMSFTGQLAESGVYTPVQSEIHDLLTSFQPLENPLDLDLKTKYCRICLDTIKTAEIEVTEETRTEFLYLTNTPLDESPDLSQILCADCYVCLRNSFKFKAVCVENQKNLLEKLNKGKKKEKNVESPANPPSSSKNNQKKDYDRLEIPMVLINEIKEEPLIIKKERRDTELSEDNNRDLHQYYLNLTSQSESTVDPIREEKPEVLVEPPSIIPALRNVPIKRSAKKEGLPVKKLVQKTGSNPSKNVEREMKNQEEKPKLLAKDVPTKCEYCDKIFKKCSLYKHVKAIHEKDRKYLCDLCAYSTYSADCFRSHIGRHVTTPTFKCEICTKLFNSKMKLDSHRRVFHEKRYNVICQHCGLTIGTKGQLQYHILKVHKIGIEDAPRLICDLCGYECLLKSHMNIHFRVIHRTKPEICKICGVSVKGMESHLETHKGYFRYKCSELLEDGTPCTKAFRTSNRRKNHITIQHKNMLPFICNRCERGYTSSISLREHILAEHYNLQLDCLIKGCRTKFRTKRALKGHIKVVHRELSGTQKLEYLKMVKKLKMPEFVN